MSRSLLRLVVRVVLSLPRWMMFATWSLSSMPPESAAAPPPPTEKPTLNTSEQAGGQLESLHADPEMAEIIQAVIKEEAHYRDLETVVRDETHYNAEQSTAPTTVTRLHVIQQDGLYYFDSQEVTPQQYAEDERHRRSAAFDGDRTISVEYGNSANIHLARHEPPQMRLPHSWAISTFEVNFPLSVYLQGGEAVEEHPKVRRHPDAMGMGTSYEIYRIETELVGDETVGGLNCKKIRVKRWNRREGDPVIQYLWLAPERNYICVRSQWMTKINGQEVAAGDAIVSELQQLAPGVWLPASVIGLNYDFDSLREGQPFPRETRTLKLESAAANSDHGRERFHIEIPDGIPVYTIDAGRVVDGPHHPQPTPQPSKPATLEEIIEQVRENERLYANIELDVRSTYQMDWIGNVLAADDVDNDAEIYSIVEDARFISVNGRHYYQGETVWRTAEGPPITERLTAAYNGEWTRTVSMSNREDPDTIAVDWASLGRTGEAMRGYRPHKMVLQENAFRPLSEFLLSEWSDERLGYRHRVVYEGDDTIDGLLCYRLRRDLTAGESDRVSSSQYLWIARDRNYLPTRTEWRGSRWSDTLPTEISTVEELREVSPGVWLPVKWTSVSFKSQGDGVSAGQIVLNWKREFQVQSAMLNPQPEPYVFTTVHVPKGTKFSVSDENGDFVGTRVQENDGNLSLTREQWQEILAQAEDRAKGRDD